MWKENDPTVWFLLFQMVIKCTTNLKYFLNQRVVLSWIGEWSRILWILTRLSWLVQHYCTCDVEPLTCCDWWTQVGASLWLVALKSLAVQSWCSIWCVACVDQYGCRWMEILTLSFVEVWTVYNSCFFSIFCCIFHY